MTTTNLTIDKKRFSLCNKPVQLHSNHFELNIDEISFDLYYTIDDIVTEWDQFSLQENFAQSSYLKTIEKDSPPNLRHLYVIVKKGNDTVGTILMQSLGLKFNDSFDYEKYTTNRSGLSKLWQKIRQRIVGSFQFRMLTVGNLYLTGQYGFHFNDKIGERQYQFRIVDKIVAILKKELCNTPYRFSGLLMKDYFYKESIDQPQSYGLTPFEIDPNMILTIRKSWGTFDDYLLDMRSKYRIRLKNAIRKFKGIERRILSHDDIVNHNDQMYQLYSEILEGSGFVLVKGEENYFVNLKEELKDELQVVAYFLEDEMVGFYTWTLDKGKLDSHFIGVSSALNLRHQIYLNILMDLVKDAISVKADSIYYFRTALEIKSSVGAEPFKMVCYFRHNNVLINKLIPLIFKYFVPSQSWSQRHPFKIVKA